MEQNPYAAPTAEVAEQRTTAAPLSVAQMLFSFNGRMRRGQYWACALGSGVVLMVVIGIAAALSAAVGGGPEAGPSPIFGVLVVLAYPALLWSSFALQAKRWHDRGKSGWWALLGFVPLANIWVMIEVGFLAGTPGPNDYGPPPP